MDNVQAIKKQLFFATFVSICALNITIPALSPLSKEIGFSATKTGLMLGTGGLFMFLFAVFWGKLSDRIGRKNVVLIGLSSVGLSYALFVWGFYFALSAVSSLTISFLVLVAIRSLMGVFLPATQSACFAGMADITTEEERPAGMALIGMAMGLAIVVGPAVGGVATTFFGLFSPFYLTIIVLFGSAAWVYVKMPNFKSTHHAIGMEAEQNKPLLSFRLFSYLFISFSCISTIIALQIILAYMLQDKFGQSSEQSANYTALLLTLSGFFLVSMQVLQTKVFKFRPKLLVSLAGILMICSISLLVMATNINYLLISFPLNGAAGGFGMIGLNVGASLSVSRKSQGAVAGIVGMNQALAAIVAPFVGPFLYDFGGNLLFFALLACIITGLIMISFTKKL